MTKEKITIAQVLTNVRTMAENYEMVGEIPADAVIEYCDKTLAQMAKKNEKARERAAQKRQAGDELKATIFDMLNDEWVNADTILAELADEDADLTKAKIVARLGQLVRDGVAEKESQKVDKRVIMHYRKVNA